MFKEVDRRRESRGGCGMRDRRRIYSQHPRVKSQGRGTESEPANHQRAFDQQTRQRGSRASVSVESTHLTQSSEPPGLHKPLARSRTARLTAVGASPSHCDGEGPNILPIASQLCRAAGTPQAVREDTGCRLFDRRPMQCQLPVWSGGRHAQTCRRPARRQHWWEMKYDEKMGERPLDWGDWCDGEVTVGGLVHAE